MYPGSAVNREGEEKKTKTKTLSVNVCHCSSRRIMFAARVIGGTYRGPLPDRNPTACCLCVVLFSPPPPPKSFMRNHSPTCWNRGSFSSLHRGDLIYCYRLYVCMTLGLIKTPVRWPPNMLLPKYSTSTPDPFLVYERYEIYVRAARQEDHKNFPNPCVVGRTGQKKKKKKGHAAGNHKLW